MEPRSIDVWVTMGEDKKVVFSFLRPVFRKIMLTDRIGIYHQPGDMLWVPGQCEEWPQRMIGRKLEVGVPVRCTMSIVPKDNI